MKLRAPAIAAIALAFTSPAMARFECSVSAREGDPVAPRELVSANIQDHYSRDPMRVSVVRQLFLSAPPGWGNRSRLLTLSYGETKESPWNLRGVNIAYRYPVGELKRSLFGFLVLDSGEYVVRLGEAERYRDKSDPNTKLLSVHITAGYPKESPDQAFLSALSKAKSMAFELKDAAGETLVRENFDLKHTELMQRMVATVQKMERENCRYWEDPPEFHQ